MVDANLYFKEISVDRAIADLGELPEAIRPVYFAEDEGKIKSTKDVLSDVARFKEFRRKNQLGFFLYSEDKISINVSISSPRRGYSSISIDLDKLPPELAADFFNALASHKPTFGFACDYDEYKHRNRHYITIGKNHIEAWIGRGLDKYISGVYWYTLLSDDLLKQHCVNLDDLSAEAISTETLNDNSLHLLKFFKNPEDWRENAERLDDLCERTDGLFSRRSVEAAVAGVTNYLEYNEAISDWR